MRVDTVAVTGTPPQWARETPVIAHLSAAGPVALTHSVTALTGPNGSGKSTLLEAVARAYGFPLTGGTHGAQLPGPRGDLYGSIAVTGEPRAKAGYFLRSETHNGTASSYGEFLRRSHGESILEATSRFTPEGLYILDEPEAGLSAVSQMALLAQLHAIAAAGAQVLMVTHSPILLAVPGAEIFEVRRASGTGAGTGAGTGTECVRGVSVEETIPFRAMRDFLADPAEIAEFMAARAEDIFPAQR